MSSHIFNNYIKFFCQGNLPWFNIWIFISMQVQNNLYLKYSKFDIVYMVRLIIGNDNWTWDSEKVGGGSGALGEHDIEGLRLNTGEEANSGVVLFRLKRKMS